MLSAFSAAVAFLIAWGLLAVFGTHSQPKTLRQALATNLRALFGLLGIVSGSFFVFGSILREVYIDRLSYDDVEAILKLLHSVKSWLDPLGLGPAVTSLLLLALSVLFCLRLPPRLLRAHPHLALLAPVAERLGGGLEVYRGLHQKAMIAALVLSTTSFGTVVGGNTLHAQLAIANARAAHASAMLEAQLIDLAVREHVRVVVDAYLAGAPGEFSTGLQDAAMIRGRPIDKRIASLDIKNDPTVRQLRELRQHYLAFAEPQTIEEWARSSRWPMVETEQPRWVRPARNGDWLSLGRFIVQSRALFNNWAGNSAHPELSERTPFLGSPLARKLENAVVEVVIDKAQPDLVLALAAEYPLLKPLVDVLVDSLRNFGWDRIRSFVIAQWQHAQEEDWGKIEMRHKPRLLPPMSLPANTLTRTVVTVQHAAHNDLHTIAHVHKYVEAELNLRKQRLLEALSALRKQASSPPKVSFEPPTELTRQEFDRVVRTANEVSVDEALPLLGALHAVLRKTHSIDDLRLIDRHSHLELHKRAALVEISQEARQQAERSSIPRFPGSRKSGPGKTSRKGR